MDCKTARLLVELAGPAGELDPEEAQALEGHLAECPECSTRARAERRFHAAMGAAMCAVVPPPGLRDQLLSRLAKERGDHYRRYAARGMRVAAALAACLLIAFLIFHWRINKKPSLDPEGGWRDPVVFQQPDAPSKEKADAFLREQKVAAPAPSQFNYALLVDYGMTERQGERVPYLLFQRQDRNLSARVYVVTDQQFDADSLQSRGPSSSGGYSVEVIRPPGARYAYVVVYAGDSLTPFLVDTPQPAT
jgi:hypothetical protein